MKHYYEDGGLRLFHGSNKDILPTFEAESYDSIVTDPPYELGFMGKGWDSSGIAYDVDMWRECWRVLKPGGYLLAFGGTRTWHRIATAIEDAGFEIRDSIAWLYGSGFPKSMDVSKAIDKRRDDSTRVAAVCRWLNAERVKAGVTHAQIREALGLDSPGSVVSILSDNAKSHPRCPTLDQWEVLRVLIGFGGEMDAEVTALNGRKGSHGEAWESREITGAAGAMWDQWEMRLRGHSTAPNGRTGERRDIPATPDAERWQGWGTALKPAFEPIIVARKPLGEKTVAANVLAHGTGALNIDATRIESERPTGWSGGGSALYEDGLSREGGEARPTTSGRWPANVALDESQAAELDRQAPSTGGSGKASGPSLREPTGTGVAFGARNGLAGEPAFYGGDKGGASRFFPTFRYEAKAPGSERPEVDGVAHATVKPLDLMRWLVRLVTRRGGRVLDPFAGSGTTGEAALLEGMEVDLIELEADHLPLILQRVRKPLQPSMFDWEAS